MPSRLCRSPCPLKRYRNPRAGPSQTRWGVQTIALRSSLRPLLRYDGQDIVFPQDEIRLLLALDLGPRVPDEHDPVAHENPHRDALALRVERAGTDRHDLGLLRLLRGDIREVNVSRGYLFLIDHPHNDPITQGLDEHFRTPFRVSFPQIPSALHWRSTEAQAHRRVPRSASDHGTLRSPPTAASIPRPTP